MNTVKQFLFLVLVIQFLSCNKKEDLNYVQPPGLGGDTWEKTAIDNWIYDSLTLPYNIAVKYKWDAWELQQLDRDITPPDEAKIIPALSILKQVWIDPYIAETGSEVFIKQFSPKQLIMLGSVQYEANQTALLGTAEGGKSITFFDINQNYFSDRESSVLQMIHAAHHEFAHILHQNIRYPPEFKTVYQRFGLDGYSATWFNVSSQEALSNGYITPYASSGDIDDFAEMVSNMLMLGKQRFDELVNFQNSDARQALRTKEEIIVQYLLKNYKIDFYSLQNRVQQAVRANTPDYDLSEMFGFDKAFPAVSVNPGNPALIPLPSAFLSIYNLVRDSINASSYDIIMDSIEIRNQAADSSTLRIFVHRDEILFAIDYIFSTTQPGSDTYDYTFVRPEGSGELLETQAAPLINYFNDHNFKLEWYKKPDESITPRAKFIPIDLQSAFFIGQLVE